jgi:hypothetical protein
MELYSVNHIVKVVSGALNDSQRSINYQDCVEYFESFETHAVKYLLWKMGVLRLTTQVNSATPIETSAVVQTQGNLN